MPTRLIIDGGEEFLPFAKLKLKALKDEMRRASACLLSRRMSFEDVEIFIQHFAPANVMGEDASQSLIRIVRAGGFIVTGGQHDGASYLFIHPHNLTAKPRRITVPDIAITGTTSFTPYIARNGSALYRAATRQTVMFDNTTVTSAEKAQSAATSATVTHAAQDSYFLWSSDGRYLLYLPEFGMLDAEDEVFGATALASVSGDLQDSIVADLYVSPGFAAATRLQASNITDVHLYKASAQNVWSDDTIYTVADIDLGGGSFLPPVVGYPGLASGGGTAITVIGEYQLNGSFETTGVDLHVYRDSTLVDTYSITYAAPTFLYTLNNWSAKGSVSEDGVVALMAVTSPASVAADPDTANDADLSLLLVDAGAVTRIHNTVALPGGLPFQNFKKAGVLGVSRDGATLAFFRDGDLVYWQKESGSWVERASLTIGYGVTGASTTFYWNHATSHVMLRDSVEYNVYSLVQVDTHWEVKETSLGEIPHPKIDGTEIDIWAGNRAIALERI